MVEPLHHPYMHAQIFLLFLYNSLKRLKMAEMFEIRLSLTFKQKTITDFTVNYSHQVQRLKLVEVNDKGSLLPVYRQGA